MAIDQAMLAEAAHLGTSTLHEAAGQRGALQPAIKPLAAHMRLSGPAFTVLSPPADNLWLHRAIYAAQPGDVLVVNVSGRYEAGYWGEIMTHAAIARSLGGLVIDGCVRDGSILEGLPFPVFARGLCMRGTTKVKDSAGSIGAPVALGDVVVAPGDLVVGDADGVVVVAAADIRTTLEKARTRVEKEEGIIRALKEGKTTLDLYGWS